eukprot:2847688-Pleurochrysis_carterae.AAC.1
MKDCEILPRLGENESFLTIGGHKTLLSPGGTKLLSAQGRGVDARIAETPRAARARTCAASCTSQTARGSGPYGAWSSGRPFG